MKEVIGIILIWIWLGAYLIANIVKIIDQLRK